jgi:TolA-binding protein
MVKGLGIILALTLVLGLPRPALGQGVRTSNGSIGTGLQSDPAAELENRRQRCNLYMGMAEKSYKEGSYLDGRESLMMARVLLADKDQAARWGTLAGQFNEAGVAMFKTADEAWDAKNYDVAIKGYRMVAGVFDELPVAKTAREKLKAISTDPAVKAVFNETKAGVLLKAVQTMVAQAGAKKTAASSPASRPTTMPALPEVCELGAAIRALDDADILKASDALANIVRTYAGAPSADDAGRILVDLRADEALQKRLDVLRERNKAQQALAGAQAYVQAGMLVKARDQYKQIIADYPGSDAAKQARTEMAQVQGRLDGMK